MSIPILTVIILILLVLSSAIKILKEYERGVIFRLGRLSAARGPGIFIIIPFIDKMVRVSLRTVVHDVPEQDIITRDNVSVKVNAVVYFRVLDPSKAIVEVEDYYYATSQLSQTTLRSILGQAELDELLSKRDKINTELQTILDQATDPWGIKVSQVEIKHVDLPSDMQRAMAKQAEAERERRAKIINAQGEYQAAQKLLDAAEIMNKQPITVQLRYLQTLREVATENNSTIIFPLPIDLVKPLVALLESKSDKK
ncbi:MAG: slipin family protein [Candidatus Marinimicrobia bacterium]|nr:slipin family protein [Candidatus Neomarinimicrobiota bacterium]